jgi:hypothetical protein
MQLERTASRALKLQKHAMERYAGIAKEHPTFPTYLFLRLARGISADADPESVEAFNDLFYGQYSESRRLTKEDIAALAKLFAKHSHLATAMSDRKALEEALLKGKQLGF